MERPLTDLQLAALGRVCLSNGGGVSVPCTVGPDGYGIPTNPQMRALQKRGLIQGKAGSYSKVVHTREGLAMWRAIQERSK